MTPAIEIHGLEKSYETGLWRKTRRWGLKPLSLTIERGEIFGYLGPNGAGKTTTLKLLMGLISPSGGSAHILGANIGDPAMKRRIGYLPEQPYFYDNLTARELLLYFAQLSGIPPGERKRRVDDVLARAGISDAADMRLRKFSKGMLQRVGLAQAVLHDPEVLFLDEPMSGLDPIGRREVRDLIQSLKDEGKTVFFSTHILSDAETLCDRVAVLNEGELRGTGSVAELARAQGDAVEVVWKGAGDVNRTWQVKTTGEVSRATVPAAELERLIDAVRNARGQLISVTPVRGTLEDYFIRKVGAAQ